MGAKLLRKIESFINGVYKLDPLSKIFSRENYSGINYSDGDEVENRLAEVIGRASDITVLSTELRSFCTDWPSLYHLSGTRANILRPFAERLVGDILEIGAGCGAITRFLGESSASGASVLALEGSARRAAIARSRTRDLDNVTILAERFDNFQCDHCFDVITLIGVLEYASLFTPGQNPHLAMLRRVRSLLKPDGVVIIAIENQLGLKYFAGAPEDHLGQPMYGIEGRYHGKQPQTFGHKRLADLLVSAGFTAPEFLMPFPDYKLPVSIITERGISEDGFDAAAFAWQSVHRDPQFVLNANFSLQLTWPEVFKNGLALELANSFLIVASPQNGPLVDRSILAYHYSTDRIPRYCKEARFKLGKQYIKLDYYRLGSARLDSLENAVVVDSPIEFNLPISAEYVKGHPLSWEFLKIVSRDGWTIEEIAAFLKRYIGILEALARQAGIVGLSVNLHAKLPGKFFDFAPHNLIIRPDGSAEIIDSEWIYKYDIELKHLLFRSLLWLVGSVICFGKGADQPGSQGEFLRAALNAAGFTLTKQDVDRFVAIESAVQDAVTGRPAHDVLGFLWERTLPVRIAKITAEPSATMAELDRVVAERDAAIAMLDAVRVSHSWRVTRPLRFFARIIRYGLVENDRQELKARLRSAYHRLPLPMSIKKILRSLLNILFINKYRVAKRRILATVPFQPPSIRPAAQQQAFCDYLMWGVIDWHFRKQRPQQLAQCLAASGRRVFYISAHFIDDERPGFHVEALDQSGRVFQIKLHAKGAPVIYSSAPGIETIYHLRASVGEMLNWADSKRLISLVQHPYWYDVATVLPDCRTVYDCMDHHEGFGNTAAAILSLERALLRDADLTVVSSEWLSHIVADQAKRHTVIRNAAQFEHFGVQSSAPYRDPRGRQIIGYYGAIAEWFDQDLIASVAERFADCCVLLIGADTAGAQARLKNFSNVEFKGEVAYTELPAYLWSFDVCLLPFKVIPLTLATNPVKVYEYLSAGKPVVSVDLPELKQFGDLVSVAIDKASFLSAIADVLNEREDGLNSIRRQEFAQQQTWAHRVKALIHHAEAVDSDPLVSVIVVTYNNLHLTRDCLASLDVHSNYVALEIIVVDNASTDGTQEFLTQWVASAPNRKAILNEDNRGFAAANNQGLAAAGGEYLVLLNNDTYVTPGWIRTLVKHLQRDPNVGLIGPVTNNIGNEAKVDIAYRDMNDMLQTSARYVRHRIGKTFRLRTVAFFCVMMPRHVYKQIGPLDEAFGRGFFEDDDYCRRVEQIGKTIVCAEDVFIHHQLSASFDKLKTRERQALFEQNKAIYEAKWGKWLPHTYAREGPLPTEGFKDEQYVAGRCNVCGKDSRFFYTDARFWRESLTCEYCLTTSRYRSVAHGVLRAIAELTGIEAQSLAGLPRAGTYSRVRVYDTQPPFYYAPCAYPIPDLLKIAGWIDVELSQYKPKQPLAQTLAPGVSNQNLECLTFDDASFDIVITSDVMEHVRLDQKAHQEIYRVLRPGGIYIFTVPHERSWNQTLIRVKINDEADPSKDEHIMEPEYHGDTNGEGGGVLTYRTYGKDLEQHLAELGFKVEYLGEDISACAILKAQLFYCRKIGCS